MAEEVDAGQVAEALGISICLLLAVRLKDVAGSAFQQAMDSSADLAQVVAWLSQACDLLDSATWVEMGQLWSSALKSIEAEAKAAGRKADSAVAKESKEAARKKVAEALKPLCEPSSVRLVMADGTWADITTAWRTMQAEAAAQSTLTAEAWIEEYTNLLGSKGVGIVTGDSGVREIGGEVRRACFEAAMSAADDVCRATALSCGMDACQISVHGMCAPDHLPHQGKVYTLAELERLNESLPRPIGRGVMNCRHSLLYCFSGSSSNYTASELREFERQSTRSVTFRGVSGKELTMSAYEATQYLRKTELRIRKTKQTRMLKKTAGLDVSKYDAAIEKSTAEYKRLCSDLGENYSESRITAYTLADLS